MNEHADLSRVYQQAARPEPAAALDDAILAAAREAAAAPRRLRPKRWWSVPLALAATVLLSVSITTMVHDQQPVGDALYAPPRFAQPAAPAPVPYPATALGQAAATRAEPAAAPARAPAAVAHRDAATTRATAESAPGLVVQKAAVAPVESAVADRRAANALLVPPAPPAAVASDAAASARSATSATSAGMLSGMAARPAAPALVEKRARALSLHEEAARTADGLAPESWIAEIRDLQRAGRSADAAARLAEFRKRFPDYPLPDDLK